MEPGRSIRKRLVVNFQILVFLISLMRGTSAVSANPPQSNWDYCIHEEFSGSLCNLGEAKNVGGLQSFNCSALKRCCACPKGSFMDGYNNCTQCKPWRDCKAEGKEVLFEGNTTEDARCGDDIPQTTTTVPVTTTTILPPTVEGSTSSIEPNLTKDEPFMSSTTCNPTGDDDGKRGNPVIKFLIIAVITLGALLAIALVIILVLCFISCRSKKKPKTTSDVVHIQLSDQGVGGSSVTDV